MVGNTKQAKIVTPQEVEKLKYPLPESWKKAAGLLRDRAVKGLEYQKNMRKEWDARAKKQAKLK